MPDAAVAPLLRRLGKRFTIERAQPGQEDAICRFFLRAYADQPIDASFRDPETIAARWRWLNREYPEPFDGGLPPTWLCLKDGEILGHLAALPAWAASGGSAQPVCWGRDLIVAPEARRLGVGPALVAAAVTACRRPFMVVGLNETVTPMYARLGFHDCGLLRLFIDVDHPLRFTRTLPWPALRRGVAAAGFGLARGLRGLRIRPQSRVPVTAAVEFDVRFDQWWAGVEPWLGWVIRRTGALMTWRFRRHPTHRYTLLTATDGPRLRGIAVVRHGASRGVPTGFISELLAHPDDGEAIDALIARAAHVLRAGSPAPVFLRCGVRFPAVERGLARAGFLRAPSPLRFMASHDQGPEALGLLTTEGSWMLTTGDSDVDAL